MAKAKKLPSGSWRVLVYDYTDENEKRHYQSFTSEDPSPKGKREAEFAAAEFAKEKEERNSKHNVMTIGNAVDSYISLKEPVLSPYTIKGYRMIRNNHIADISNISLNRLSKEILQSWINKLSSNHSPKTLRNAYGLVMSSIELFQPGFHLSVTLPAKQKLNLYVPTDSDIQKLLKHIKGKELEIAVYLAAFGPMRRGELCAATSADVNGQNITVSKSMVRLPDKSWTDKSPKTYSGYRTIEYPQFVIDRIKGIEGRLVKATPDQVSNRFRRALISANLPHFRFHDLRHYAASIMHAIGVPDQYIMGRGGWSSDRVLKEIYRGEMDDQKKKFTASINGHFDNMQHEMQHDIKKCLRHFNPLAPIHGGFRSFFLFRFRA